MVQALGILYQHWSLSPLATHRETDGGKWKSFCLVKVLVSYLPSKRTFVTVMN